MENRIVWKFVRRSAIDNDVRSAINAVHCDVIFVFCFTNVKASSIVDAGEKATTGERIQKRRRVSARNVNSCSRDAIFIPLNCNSMSRVFRRNS